MSPKEDLSPLKEALTYPEQVKEMHLHLIQIIQLISNCMLVES